DLGDDAAELSRKTRLCKRKIQITQRLDRRPKVVQAFSDLRCETSQNVLDFLLCPFLKTNQFVVQFQSFQRLKEERSSAGTRAMDNSRQLLAILNPDRNHKPLIPKR